jgi:hypothetical protein
MGRLTLDAELRRKLNGLKELLEVCDERGETIGHFIPTELFEDLFYGALASESPHSKEELKRRHRESSRRRVSEIWGVLEEKEGKGGLQSDSSRREQSHAFYKD